MKRLIASISLLLIITTYLLSCEKDDLCADGTPTTPGLVIEFYKKDFQDVLNPVTNFKYYVEGSNDTLPLKPELSVSRIALPLRTDQDEVRWALQYNSTNALGVKSKNTDYFTVHYTRKETYVSRACGFKTTFTLNPETNEIPNPLIEPGDDGKFIEDYTVLTTNIENENEVHVKIFF